jgi:protein TonB
MFESTLAAQGLDHHSRKLTAFYVAVLAHFSVFAAVAAASFLDVRMPKGPELPIPAFIVIQLPPTDTDFWHPPAPAQPPPKKGGSEASHAIALPPPIVIPKSTPEHTASPAPPAVDSDTPTGPGDSGPGDTNGSPYGVPGGAGTDPGGVGVGDGPTGPVAITTEMARPQLLRKIDPIYPATARSARIGGRVTIEAVIGLEGSVEAAQIVGSTSSLFDDAALDAVRQWRYRPATLNGSPVRVYLRVIVDFTLR